MAPSKDDSECNQDQPGVTHGYGWFTFKNIRDSERSQVSLPGQWLSTRVAQAIAVLCHRPSKMPSAKAHLTVLAILNGL